jgi:hypothetical protein
VKIIVGGMIGADPHQGGATWAVLQYVLGFAALGHEVHLLELVSDKNLRPAGAALSATTNARYFREVAARYGLERSATMLHTGTHESVGLSYAQLVELGQSTDLLINISGMLNDEAIIESIPVRAYLDLDPAFVQLWHTQGIDMRFDGHTHFVTIAQAIGSKDCLVPSCGVQWITTFQPIVLSRWPVATDLEWDALTTVGNWRAYGSVEHDGIFFGQKAHSLRPLMSLPRFTGEKFCMAMAIHPDESADIAALEDSGWRLIDPFQVASTPADYQRFVQGSWAEFGISKSGYVASRCGWFSDRSICYLASGRPVIAQDTGFSEYLPTGEGLLAFSTKDDVLNAIQSLRSDYAMHSGAARRLAENHFDSQKVLPALLERLL